jgi:hypothetical protein
MQFSLKTLLLAFVVLGAGCAALMYPNRIWSSAFFTGGLVAVLFAGVAACAKRGRTRMFWIGFALLGGGYFLCAMFDDVHAFSPSQGSRAVWSEPRLLTSHLLLWCNDRLNNIRTERSNVLVGGQPYSLGVGLQMQYLARGTAGYTLIIGHSLLTLMLGFMGGAIASRIYEENIPAANGQA